MEDDVGRDARLIDRENGSKWLQKELVNCEAAHKQGVIAALVDAIALCGDFPELTPRWVLSAANNIILNGLPGGRGRTANAKAKYREGMVHYERWAHVGYIRNKQKAIKETLATLKNETSPDQKLISRAESELARIGKTWPDAYQAAHFLLAGTPWWGSADAMKESYSRVQRAIKGGDTSRFYVPLTTEGQGILPAHDGSIRILRTGWRNQT